MLAVPDRKRADIPNSRSLTLDNKRDYIFFPVIGAIEEISPGKGDNFLDTQEKKVPVFSPGNTSCNGIECISRQRAYRPFSHHGKDGVSQIRTSCRIGPIWLGITMVVYQI